MLEMIAGHTLGPALGVVKLMRCRSLYSTIIMRCAHVTGFTRLLVASDIHDAILRGSELQ